MTRLLLLCLAAVALAAVAGTVGGRWWQRPGLPARESPPPLSVEASRLNFGPVWEDRQFKWTVPVHNSESTPVTLTHVAGSCTCSGIEPQTMHIPPGETRPLTVTLDLTAPPTDPQKADGRPFAVAVWGTATPDGGKPTRVQWTIQGVVRPVLRTARAVDLGRVSVRGQPIPLRVVPVAAADDVVAVTAWVNSPDFTAQARRVYDPDGFEYSIAPRPALPVGSYRGTVALSGRTADGTTRPPIEVPVTLEVVPDIEAVPAELMTGCREVGAETTGHVTIRSLTGRPFTVDRVTAEGDGLSVAPGAETGQYLVRHRVKRTGPDNATIRFRIRCDGETTELTVAVQAHGFAGS